MKPQNLELKKELSFLYKVVTSVHSLEIDELLNEIVTIVNDISKADSILVYSLDTNKAELLLRASKNPHTALLKKIKMKVGEGITGWVAREGELVVIPEGSYTDSRFKFFSNLPEDKYEAFLSVPILYKGKVRGVINVQHRKVYKHSESEINLLKTIGNLVGGAVENALLVEESLALKEALELRKLLDRAKGILMKKKKISEEEAFRIIQKQSMDSRKSAREIAEAVILVEKLG